MKAWLWQIAHNCVVHPLLPFFGHKMDKVHDWTAEKAYPHNPHVGQTAKMLMFLEGALPPPVRPE